MEKDPESGNVMEKAQGHRAGKRNIESGWLQWSLDHASLSQMWAVLVGKVWQVRVGKRKSLELGYVLRGCLTLDETIW